MTRSLDRKLFEVIEDKKIPKIIKLKKIKYLVNLGANFDAIYQGKSSLTVASELNEEEVVAFLEEKGAKKIVLSEEQRNQLGAELYLALKNDKNEEAIDLIEAGANLEYISEDDKEYGGRNIMMMAIFKNNKDMVRKLIYEGFRVDSPNNNGTRAIHTAVKEGSKEIVDILIEAGADIDIKDDNGYTSLIWAATLCKEEIVDVLLDNKAKLNEQNNNGMTALNCACWKCNADITKKLIKAGADIELADRSGETPLITACEMNDFDVASILVNNKARINVRGGTNGWTPLMHAAFNGNNDLVKLLIANGADESMKSTCGVRLMSMAKDEETKKVIIEAVRTRDSQKNKRSNIISRLKGSILGRN